MASSPGKTQGSWTVTPVGRTAKMLAGFLHRYEKLREVALWNRMVELFPGITKAIYGVAISWEQFCKEWKEKYGSDVNVNMVEQRGHKTFFINKRTGRNEVIPEALALVEAAYTLVTKGRDPKRNFSTSLKKKMLKTQDRCVVCQAPFTVVRAEMDHKHAHSKCGPTVLENCQLLCKRCNRDKGTKSAEEYIKFFLDNYGVRRDAD